MKFHRLDPNGSGGLVALVQSPVLASPPSFVAKLRRGDGIVIASWDPDTEHGRVQALGIVGDVRPGSVLVDWRRVNFTLRPSPQGRSKWTSMPFFRFDELVAERYRLLEHFDAAFVAAAATVADDPPPLAPPRTATAAATANRATAPAPPAPNTAGPQRNRVAPDGTIFADPARGLFMGNRTSPPRWLVCDPHFQRTPREPRKYTKLFFLDEAVALAAGHRPCNTCRRERLTDYLAAARVDLDISDTGHLDGLLHRARTGPRPRASVCTLPDGVFVDLGDGHVRLKWAGALRRWTPAGYTDATMVADLRQEMVAVLTPGPSVVALRNGYVPQVHPSAN